jgi:hypothetical protein
LFCSGGSIEGKVTAAGSTDNEASDVDKVFMFISLVDMLFQIIMEMVRLQTFLVSCLMVIVIDMTS